MLLSCLKRYQRVGVCLYFTLSCLMTSMPTVAQETTDAEEGQQSTDATTESTTNSDDSNNDTSSNSAPAKNNALSRADLPPPRNIAITQQIQNDIQRVLEPDQYETTLVGEDEILLVINQADTAIVKGVAVIVGEAGRNSLNNYALASLVEPLNSYGWVTILLPAPTVGLEGIFDSSNMSTGNNIDSTNANSEPPAPTAQTTEDSNQLSNEQANRNIQPYSQSTVISNAGFIAHEQRMNQLMSSATQFSSQYPGFFLVIAQGTSAAWLSKIYSEEQVEQPDALITISVNWPEKKFNKLIPEFIAQTPTPVLDIYSQWDSEWTTKTAKKRAIAARKSLKLHYRQREIIGQPFDPNQFIYLSKEIHGWLTHMGW